MPCIDLPHLAAFPWFAGVGSVTPGPNIALALAVPATHGQRAVRPHMAGVALGVMAMLALCAAGAGAALTAGPMAAVALVLWSAGGEAVGRRLAGSAHRRRMLDMALGASLVATGAWVMLR